MLVVVEDDCTSTVTRVPGKYAGYRTPADGCLQELLGPAYEYAFQRNSEIHDREQNERDSCDDQKPDPPTRRGVRTSAILQARYRNR